MRRVARPFAGEVEHFAQHHVRVRRVFVVEYGFNVPAHGALQVADPRALNLNILRCVEHRLELPAVFDHLEVDFAVAACAKGDLRPRRNMQAARLFGKLAIAGNASSFAVRFPGQFAAEQQKRRFLFFFVERKGFAFLQNDQ
ncbi:hypothetical protein SDC9_179401 [bioreactor metagenome]|uniref:Uncharacterized protein n=1 Tax=bioreactor metagenome TaxID=1076179 RepID=A0A645H0C4_9ZZZZ